MDSNAVYGNEPFAESKAEEGPEMVELAQIVSEEKE